MITAYISIIGKTMPCCNKTPILSCDYPTKSIAPATAITMFPYKIPGRIVFNNKSIVTMPGWYIKFVISGTCGSAYQETIRYRNNTNSTAYAVSIIIATNINIPFYAGLSMSQCGY